MLYLVENQPITSEDEKQCKPSAQLHCMHATTACTDDASIVSLSPCTQLGYSLVPCLGVHVVWSVHIRAIASYMHALTRDHYRTSCTDVKWRVYETLQREQNGGLELAWSQVSL